ncbi:MAG: hypothetical protein HY741_25270 [Chloroflexi bacterium]|nr:hypothetical protein [Chloroflexota bacterium]
MTNILLIAFLIVSLSLDLQQPNRVIVHGMSNAARNGKSSARAGLFDDSDLPLIAEVISQDELGHQTRTQQSRTARVSAWPQKQVDCKTPFGSLAFALYMAKNGAPLEFVAQPKFVLRKTNQVSFPILEFDNVPTDLETDPSANYTIVLGNDNYREFYSTWIHGLDPRTIQPLPIAPTGIAQTQKPGEPWEIDTRIQWVLPHDTLGNLSPVRQAGFVDVAVDIFKRGTLESVPVDYPADPLKSGTPVLYIAEGNLPFHRFGSYYPPQKVTYTLNAQTYPRWVFPNVPVEPEKETHFIVLMTPTSRPPYVVVHPSVWTHTANTRTTIPAPNLPPSCK